MIQDTDASLVQQHRELDVAIRKAAKNPLICSVQLSAMKRKKLRLKDQIAAREATEGIISVAA